MILRRRASNQQSDKTAMQKEQEQAVRAVTRKPSERFMRSPLRARSKSSNSERLRVAKLAVDLVQDSEEKWQNKSDNFNGYVPGRSEAPPG